MILMEKNVNHDLIVDLNIQLKSQMVKKKLASQYNNIFAKKKLANHSRSGFRSLRIFKKKISLKKIETNFKQMLIFSKIKPSKINYKIPFWRKRMKQMPRDTYLFKINKHKTILEFFINILNAIKPLAWLKVKKVGGIRYKIPFFLHLSVRDYFQCVDWLIKGSKSYKNKPFIIRIFIEIININFKKGYALHERKFLHKLILNNRPLTRFL